MFSFSKSVKTFPTLVNQTKYDSSDIYNQLIKDSFNKCYLCGEDQGDVRSERVEHFTPHEDGKHKTLKYDWNNLLFSCDHCNNRKSSTYNKLGGNKDILNPTKDDIENEIIHFYNTEILGESIVNLSSTTNSEKSLNTIELLDKIYNEDLKNNKDFAKANKCRTLKKNIIKEIFNFRKQIMICNTTEKSSYQESEIIEKIKKHLNKKSNFYEFKLGLIKKNTEIKEFLIERKIISEDFKIIEN
ncbi:HNH endonuclease [Cetobacterium somerae]